MAGEGQSGNHFKSWQEEIYWTHFQFIHFTQFLHNDFQQQLALPKTFSDNLKKKLPENVTLKGPSGVLWNIGLVIRDDSVYFENGWERFVKDHSLKENDFLVFKYNGESLFEVLVFDGNSFCEKATSYFVGKCGPAQAEQGGTKAKDNNNSVEEVNTASNGGVECGSSEKFRRLKKVGTPLAVPFETANGKTSNAGVRTDSPELFPADAVTKTTPLVVPFQSAGKRIKKPVNEISPGPTKKRGRPPKVDNSSETIRDLVAYSKEHSDSSMFIVQTSSPLSFIIVLSMVNILQCTKVLSRFDTKLNPRLSIVRYSAAMEV
ncbi:hypothetical protein KIW84_060281 [Lathyrus oleraceus]|uniref:TF-B3 domain-containing protein n=1 Tax=Pisum sativum TaxID=3888 RepID=A0A9D4VZ93_PEA|nr:hypothetical protein KIW84_060281 [Pisum sativum]